MVTASCSGLVGDAEDADDRELAPGLAESGVTEPHLLVTEHRSQLEDVGYRTELERTATDDGAVVGSETVSQVVAPGGSPARERAVLEDETGTVEYDRWIHPETPLVRHDESGVVDSVAVEGDESEQYVLEGTADALGSYESASFRLVLAEEGDLAAYALEGVLPDEAASVLAVDRTTVEETFALEPTDAEPEVPTWFEETHEEIVAEHDE